MFKLKVVLLTLLVFILGYTTVNAAGIGLYLDGKTVTTDVSPVIVQNRSFVPVRGLFEKMGAEVTWINSRKQVIIRSSSVRIVLNVGSTTAYVGNEEIKLDAAPFIKDGRTMVPVRFVSENLNYDVKWENNNVYITSGKSQSTSKPPNITKINIDKKANGTDVIINVANMQKPNVWYADSPTRFIADFPSTSLSVAGSKISSNSKEVKEVRYAIHPEYTRVVIESSIPVTYNVTYTSTTMTISVKDENSSSSAEEDKQTTPPVTVLDGDMLIVIDPGHGGTECGAVGYDSNGNIALLESNVNLAIARATYDSLTARGISVVMTRSDDVRLEVDDMEDLYARSGIANQLGATFFVSIHCNSFEGSKATGTEVLYADNGNKVYSGVTSKKLAETVLKNLLKTTGLADRGVKDGSKIAVLRTSTMPAILIETAFISNPHDMALLQDENKVKQMGVAIADGIIQAIGMLK